MNTKPHIHRDVIIAWANGASLECRKDSNDTWRYIDRPAFYGDWQYRVKPENVVRWCPVFRMPAGSLVVGMGVVSSHDSQNTNHRDRACSDKHVGTIRIEINPDTLELVSASMDPDV